MLCPAITLWLPGARTALLKSVFEMCREAFCSGYLHSLKPGDCITAAFQANPGFRLKSSRKPVILIGAGAGIGPLVGFIRNNRQKQPLHLYFGARHPQSTFSIAGSWGNGKRRGCCSPCNLPSRARGLASMYKNRLRQNGAELASSSAMEPRSWFAADATCPGN